MKIFPACVLMLLAAVAVNAAETLPLPAGLIPLQSPEGTRLLDESDARANFYTLIQHLTSQQRLTYCGVASAVTVLNTIRPTNTPPCETLDSKVRFFDPSRKIFTCSCLPSSSPGFSPRVWVNQIR